MRTHRRLEGEALWEGRLACARVTMTIRADVPSPARATVRFDDAIDPALRDGLELLRKRHGAFAARLADRLGEIEVAGRDASSGGEWRVVGRLQGAVARHAPRALAQTAFTVQVVSATGSVRADEMKPDLRAGLRAARASAQPQRKPVADGAGGNGLDGRPGGGSMT